MTIQERTRDGVSVWDIQGKVVGEESRTLKRHLDAFVEACEGTPFLLLNVADVPFLDSAGLGAIVLAYQRVLEREGEMALLAPSSHVRRLLTVARLTQKIPIFEDEKTAVASLRRRESPSEA